MGVCMCQRNGSITDIGVCMANWLVLAQTHTCITVSVRVDELGNGLCEDDIGGL